MYIANGIFNYDFDWFDLVHNLDNMGRKITLLVIDLESI